MVQKWPQDGMKFLHRPSVVRWSNGGFRVGLMVTWKSPRPGKNWFRTAVFDADGSPLAVWRQSEEYCALDVPLLTPEHVWLGATQITESGGTIPAYVRTPYAELATTTSVLPFAVGNQGALANENTLAHFGLNGNSVTIFDAISNTAKTFGGSPYPEYKQPNPVADSALMRCYLAQAPPAACIWNRSTHDVQPLLDKGAAAVADAKSDGETLVWIQAPGTEQPDGSYPPGDIWTSPFVTTASAVVPKKRRPAPKVRHPAAIANAGYYAFASGYDGLVHVYRLSDMRHWSFEHAPNWTPPFDVAYVDAQEVWFGHSTGIARQHLDALGPGDPPP